MGSNDQPTFSICIPNFNNGSFIGDTIRSVLEQDYPHFEIIIADNASTDNSVEVIQSFHDPRIRLICNRYNIGFAPNLQRVTVEAKGDFINLLSSDDQMKPGALSAYVEVIRRTRNGDEPIVLYSDVETFDQDGAVKAIVCKDGGSYHNRFHKPEEYKPVNTPEGGCWQLFDSREVLRDCVRDIRSFAPFLSTVYSRNLWESVEGYNSVRTIGPDKYFNFKLLAQKPKVVYINRVLYRYRIIESPNRWAAVRTLKQPIDDYLYTLEWSDKFLEELGLTKKEVVTRFIDRVCLHDGLSILGRGNYAQAFRLLHFGLASYPLYTLSRPMTYPLMFLLWTGPIGMMVAKMLRWLHHQD